MPTIELDLATVDYEDHGSGPPIVFLHGPHMTASLWERVVDELAGQFRCLAPTLPLGAHRHPLPADPDLTLDGLATIVDRFLAGLGIDDATLVGNDTGGAIAQAVVTAHPDRVGRLVLASCEAFDNYPPGLPGRVDRLSGRLPGGIWQGAQAMRFGPMWRLPLTFGRMAKRPIPQPVREAWFGPLRSSRAVRRDFRRFARSVDPAELTATTERLADVDRPALVVWAREDRIMPPEHATRLADLLPKAEDVVWIDDSYTLIPLDQPAALARAIRDFTG